jgi:DNA replication protein DnaC
MDRFEEFWRMYPRKVGRLKAMRCWKKLSAQEKLAAIRGVLLWSQTVQWQSSGGMYIPYASTFLAQERWKEEAWSGCFEGKI